MHDEFYNVAYDLELYDAYSTFMFERFIANDFIEENVFDSIDVDEFIIELSSRVLEYFKHTFKVTDEI